MVTKEPSEILASMPEDAQQIVLALSILSTRIQTLAPEDSNDLFRLMMTWAKAQDKEERSGIRLAMIEILTQGKIAASRLPKEDSPMAERSKAWANHVGKTIRHLREKAGWTQSQLAAKAGLPQSHLSRLENAEHTATNLTLAKIAKALGVEVGQLDPCAE